MQFVLSASTRSVSEVAGFSRYLDQGLRFHRVEGNSDLDVLPVGDDALSNVPDDGGFDDLGEDPVLVHLALGEAEVVHVINDN